MPEHVQKALHRPLSKKGGAGSVRNSKMVPKPMWLQSVPQHVLCIHKTQEKDSTTGHRLNMRRDRWKTGDCGCNLFSTSNGSNISSNKESHCPDPGVWHRARPLSTQYSPNDSNLQHPCYCKKFRNCTNLTAKFKNTTPNSKLKGVLSGVESDNNASSFITHKKYY